ncbi:ATP-binding cassette domain-containing protein, partial [Devosia sp.]|uniref:ATP-binding cassette domain-containing protein n=1 Tax=Devosia sp. TaxID=1871048 RepID=UPI001AC4D965
MTERIDDAPLLSLRNLVKRFPGRNGRTVHAVENVSFDIRRGSTVGLVGESGSGKTTVGRSILRLVEPTGGEAIFDGTDIFALGSREMRAWRKRLQIVFQDPYSSLNPRMRIDAILGEALDACGYPKGAARKERVVELMTLVGLPPEYSRRFPHEFS